MAPGRAPKRRRVTSKTLIPPKGQVSSPKSKVTTTTVESQHVGDSAEESSTIASRPETKTRPAEEIDAKQKSSSKSEATGTTDSSNDPPLPSLEPGTLSKKHLIFKDWAVSKGVIIHPSITPAALPGRGIGLQAIKAIPERTRILFIPEKAIFKPRADDAKHRPNLSPHAHLALSAFKHFPHDSELGLWVDTWPNGPDISASLPLFWRSSLQDELPLSTKAILHRQEHDFKADKSSANVKHYSFDYYWAIVNSRSFHWKPPGAKPGYMVLCPFIDYLNHGPQGTGVDVQQKSKGFEVWTDRDYSPNEEILFTYGAHSNDKLLIHYGFLHCPPTKQSPTDDSLNLDHIILPKLSETVKSTLQDTGYLGNYSYIPREGEYCFRTQVAIRAQLFSANEWEYFCLNGEDMGVDRSKLVEEWLEIPLQGFLEEARVRIHQCEDWEGLKEDEGPLEVIKERWTQIEEGLCKALGWELSANGETQ